MVYLGLAGIAFLINFIINRRKIIEYEVFATAIYLIAFVFVQSFDILFVLYLVFFAIPYIRDIQKIEIRVFVAAVYIIVKLLIAFFHESQFSILATFLTRYFPILFLVLINPDRSVDTHGRSGDEYEQRILRLVVFLDLLIAALLYTRHNTDVFVVSHQPVGANLSLVGIFLVMDISLMKDELLRKHRIENMFYAVVFMGMALISDIRGYIIIVLPCALFSIVNYIFGEKRRKAGLALLIVFSIVIMGAGLVASTWARNIIDGFDTDIGYRVIENRFFRQLVINSNPFRWLFGYWVGATGANISTSEVIFPLVNGSSFYYFHLMTGATLLNYWFTVAKDLGIVGLGIYVWFYVLLGRRTSNNIGTNIARSQRIGLFLYLGLYAFMLMYRTSCTNGLIELYIVYMISCNRTFRDSGLYIEN